MSFEKPIDKLTYINLLRFAFNENSTAYPSIKKLAMMASVSENPIRDAIKRLVKMGLVTVEERTSEHGDNDSNLYTVYDLTDTMKANSVSDKDAYQSALKADKERKKAKHEAKKLSTKSTSTSNSEVGKKGTSNSEGDSNSEGGVLQNLEDSGSNSEDKKESFKNNLLKDLKREEDYNTHTRDLRSSKIEISKGKIEEVTKFTAKVAEDIATKLYDEKDITTLDYLVISKAFAKYKKNKSTVGSLVPWFVTTYVNEDIAASVDDEPVYEYEPSSVPTYNWLEDK
jgi:DNA-binding transcriptional regulator YhcF (GntR family)